MNPVAASHTCDLPIYIYIYIYILFLTSLFHPFKKKVIAYKKILKEKVIEHPDIRISKFWVLQKQSKCYIYKNFITNLEW